MKILNALMIAAVLLLAPAYAFSSNLGYMHISLIEGDVQIKTPDAEDWGFASINSPLAEGDQVWVPEGGRCELQLNTGTYIRLDSNSSLQILSMDKDSSQFYLSQGHAYIFYDAPAGSVIQVDTPDASTRAFNRAIFRIDMSDQYTDVAVYKGYVETENQVGKARINAGEMLSLGRDTNGEVASLGPPDEWEKWNKTRNDKILAGRYVSSRYLPAELRAYSYDYDTYGRWVQVPSYGYVWTPTVVVGAVWSPYRYGRWVWIGGDYVWISYDRWGWAPYHYGRWTYIVRVGWCWVPPPAGAVFWGPGYVAWVATGDYIGWVPLAPREIYYSRGYYGPHSVNIINIKRVTVVNVYKNINVNNGVTIVNRKTFNAASPKIIDLDKRVIQEKIFVKNNISVGAPDIKPSKAGYSASDKPIPPAKLPPHPVRNIQVKELNKSRPLIKEQNKSVLNPGAKPKTLPVNTVTTPRTPGKEKPRIQRVQPSKKGAPEAPGGRRPGGERPPARPAEKRPIRPDSVPVPGGEKKPVKPEDRVRPGTESSPAPGGERPQVKPSGKRPPLPEGIPAPGGERKPVTPEKKMKPAAPEDDSEQKEIKKRIEPRKKGKAVEPGSGFEPEYEEKPTVPYNGR